jgi:hypothetical protein
MHVHGYSAKISQLVNNMCTCLSPVVEKSGTNYYHLVTQSRFPNLRSSGRNVRLWDNPFQGGIWLAVDMECAVQSYPRFLASGNGLSKSSGNEIACYKVDEANRLATSCPNQSDIVCTQQVDGNRLAATCYEQPVSYSLVGTTCIKTVTVNQPCNKVITTCFKLITTTGNKQCEHIGWAKTSWQQTCYNLLADL